eukprot:730412-Amphidinium_carterae.1
MPEILKERGAKEHEVVFYRLSCASHCYDLHFGGHNQTLTLAMCREPRYSVKEHLAEPSSIKRLSGCTSPLSMRLRLA